MMSKINDDDVDVDGPVSKKLKTSETSNRIQIYSSVSKINKSFLPGYRILSSCNFNLCFNTF